ncbi:MAG: V4R domain-containing protein [Chloroflexota bacterium]
MEIKNKTEHDPVRDLHMSDAYMRWALLSAEEVIGKQGMSVVLRDAGLEKFIDNYPPENFDFGSDIRAAEYADLCAGLLNFFGRAGKSMTLRIGRIGSRLATEKQGAVFNVAAKATAKLMPVSAQIKLVIESLQDGFNKLSKPIGENYQLSYEDRGDRWAYIAAGCPMCAGKQSSESICLTFNGILQQSLLWLTGKEFEVVEVECRAAGAPACVWEISNTPKE